jgi:uncharacterized cupredoxin-like copper-binding protein
METTMRTTKATLVAVILTGALALGGAAVSAQSAGDGADQDMPGNSACLAAMHEMMALMGEHMGSPMAGQGSGPGAMMDDPMMGPGSSPGMMGSVDADCMALMGQMMAMMREHTAGPSTGAAPDVTPAPASLDSHHPEATGSPAHGESDASALRIAVSLTDALRIEPAAMSVPVGVPVTFVVTNVGAVPHEFVVGDEAAQQAHETTMQGQATMDHDDATAIGLAPGETKELTLTFAEPGELLAGCHIPGHYPAGMRAVITVT